MNLLVGSIAGECACGCHCTFIEGSLRAIAVVTAVAEKDCSLLAHRIISAVDARSVKHYRQLAVLCVAAHGSPAVRFSFGDCGHEAPGDARQVHAKFGSIRIDAPYKIVLLVRHNPRAGRMAVKPSASIPEIGRFHGPIVVVTAVDFGVTVVEAASGVVVQAVDHPVLPLCLIIDCRAFRVVLAKSHSGLDENAVNLVSHYGDGSHVGERKVIKATERWAAESTARCLGKVVVLRRLVVNLGDPAICVHAELVLSRRVCVSTRVRDR